ncbi:hypothetical protein FACS18942_01840 [Planctomycetales bacterium]|nr:hypothetical protein FACS18942_01840 [Planctomycetales bacterium]
MKQAGLNPRKLVFVDESGAKLLYLPPYSPDLNPIENSFAKEKSILRKAKIRDVDKLLEFLERHRRNTSRRMTAMDISNTADIEYRN